MARRVEDCLRDGGPGLPHRHADAPPGEDGLHLREPFEEEGEAALLFVCLCGGVWGVGGSAKMCVSCVCASCDPIGHPQAPRFSHVGARVGLEEAEHDEERKAEVVGVVDGHLERVIKGGPHAPLHPIHHVRLRLGGRLRDGMAWVRVVGLQPFDAACLDARRQRRGGQGEARRGGCDERHDGRRLSAIGYTLSPVS